MISPDELAKYIAYDPETGIFTFVHDCGYRNRIKAGDTMGSVSKRGYITLSIYGVQYRAHRVAWAMMTGSWSKYEIDHKNGEKGDNRWCNLREATRSQNCQNARKYDSNTSGFKGVHRFDKTYWRATVSHDGKRHHIGLFRCPTAAYVARIAKVKELHGEFMRLA